MSVLWGCCECYKVIHSFFQQICIEHLLYARYYSRCLGYSREQNTATSYSQRASLSGERLAVNQTSQRDHVHWMVVSAMEKDVAGKVEKEFKDGRPTLVGESLPKKVTKNVLIIF